MLLHRYFNSHAFETLKRARLKTSRISSFNDSFEFLYFTTGKKLRPEEVQKNLPALLGNPAFRAGLKAAIEKQSSPVSVEEIEELLLNNPKVVCDHASKIWPDIVQKTELSIERRRQIVDQELRTICLRLSMDNSVFWTISGQILLAWSHTTFGLFKSSSSISSTLTGDDCFSIAAFRPALKAGLPNKAGRFF